MLCQNCGKNEANVKYTQIINGEKKEMILCEECANKKGIGDFTMSLPMNFSNFLGDFFDDYEDSLSLPSFVKQKSQKCENCGQSYDEFVKTGLLGCPDCYDAFSDRLDQILKNIQGHIMHTGRKPLNIDKKLENVGENSSLKNKEKNETIENAKIKTDINNEEDELKKLENDLAKAIKEERYEDAAVIRDNIKKLRKE